MTPEKLNEFDAACRRSMKEADAWLDAHIGSYEGGTEHQGVATKSRLAGGVGKPVYAVKRYFDNYDDARGSEYQTALLHLMGSACLKGTLQRQLDDADLQSIEKERVPGAYWDALVDGIRLSGTGHLIPDSDVQALACLRLLQSRMATQDFLWLQRWVVDGHDLDEMHASVQAYFADSPWGPAADALQTRADMVKVIESHAVAQDATVGDEQPRARRSMCEV